MGRFRNPLGVVAAVSAALATSVCSEPAGVPGEFFPPDLVEFQGRFGITHSFSIPGMPISAGCTGVADLKSGIGLAFDGTINIDSSGPCAAFPARIGQIIGSIRDEVITFSVSGVPDPMAAIQCSTVGGAVGFEGSFTTREVPGNLAVLQTLRGTRELVAQCGDEEVTARWEIRASRR